MSQPLARIGFTVALFVAFLVLPPVVQAQDCGDFSESDGITATDALGILRSSVGSSFCLVCVCDVDMSGAVTATDALATLQFAVGVPITLTCQADENPVAWDGGGDGLTWTDPLNWDTDTRIPNGCDDVTIAAGPVVTVTHESGSNGVFRLVSDFPLDMNGGSLTLRDIMQVNGRLLLNGGTIANGTLLAPVAPAFIDGTNGTAEVSPADIVATSNHTTLINMTVNAPIEMSSTNSGIDVRGGLTLNDTATLAIPGSRILFTGQPQIVSGSGQIVLSETNGFVSISQGEQSSLTIAEGFLVRGSGGDVGTNSGFVSFTNDGTIDSDMPGIIRVSGFGGLTNNGTLRSSGGDLWVSHTWTNNGTVEAGAGHLVQFRGDQNTLSPSSIIQVDIVGASQFGRVTTLNAIELNGTLAINTMTNGTPLDLGDSMVVMTYPSKSGDFSAITGTDIGGGKEFVVDVGATEIRLTVVAAGS